MTSIRVADNVKRGRNKLAVTVVLGHAIKHIFNSGLSFIILPEIKSSLALSGTQHGSLLFARQAMGWGVTMGSGYLGDRFAHRASLLLFISLTLMGVSYLVAGLAGTYWTMFAAMLFVGIGPSMYHAPAIGALSRRFPDKRGFAISLHGTGGSIGETIGPLVTAGLLVFLTWQGVLRVSALPAFGAAFLIWGMMRSVPGEAPGSASTRAYFVSLVDLLKKRVLLMLVLVTALRSMGQSAIMAFLPVYLKEDLDFSATERALYIAMAQVVGIGSQPVMGFLSDRYGRKAVLIPAMLVLSLSFVGLKYADTGVELVLVILVMGAFFYSLHTIFIAAAMDIAGGEVQSTVVSLIYGASFLGTVSPIIAGAIVDNSQNSNAFLYAAGAMLLSTTILISLRLPKTANQLAVAD